MTYSTIFDITREPFFNLGFASVGALMGLMSLGVAAIGARSYKMSSRRGAVAAWVTLLGIAGFLFGSFWSYSTAILILKENAENRSIVKNHLCRITEGEIYDFSPISADSKSDESFRVSGVRFHYNDYVASGGYHNTYTEGDPIKAGIYVRICYDGNNILTLEKASGG